MSADNWAIVQPDQANGRTHCCVNCGRAIGDLHEVACYAAAIAHQTHRRSCICEWDSALGKDFVFKDDRCPVHGDASSPDASRDPDPPTNRCLGAE